MAERGTKRSGWLAVWTIIGLGVAACSAPDAPIRATLSTEWLRWPEQQGCVDAPTTVTLPPGMRVDRFGDDKGTYFSQPGTPFAARSLPYEEARTRYRAYVVLRPMTVQSCRIAPWFGDPGGGAQYKAGATAEQLKAEGVIGDR